jgi:hypothetical protein
MIRIGQPFAPRRTPERSRAKLRALIARVYDRADERGGAWRAIWTRYPLSDVLLGDPRAGKAVRRQAVEQSRRLAGEMADDVEMIGLVLHRADGRDVTIEIAYVGRPR